jgi:hypothetical protein
MLRRTAEDWERLRDLPALLNELPVLADELGFHFYSFSYSNPAHPASKGNLLPGGDVIVQAALDFRPTYLQRSDIPLIWEPKTFAKAPIFWSEAQELGLCHGWVQPLHQGATRSYLAVLRPHVSVSTQELYVKAASVMWLSERLHLAALGYAAVSGDHVPCAPSRAAQDPAVDSRSSAARTPGTKRV